MAHIHPGAPNARPSSSTPLGCNLIANRTWKMLHPLLVFLKPLPHRDRTGTGKSQAPLSGVKDNTVHLGHKLSKSVGCSLWCPIASVGIAAQLLDATIHHHLSIQPCVRAN